MFCILLSIIIIINGKHPFRWMKISQKILGGLVGILLAGCSLQEDPKDSIIVNYAGEFYVSIVNENEGNTRVLFAYGENSKTWDESYLESRVGELENLEVTGIKVLGSAYPDYGNLTVTIEDDDEVVAEKTAPKGTARASVEYSF